MPIINFLELCVAPCVRESVSVQRGDLVFHLSVEHTDIGSKRWSVREFCHTGILARDYPDHWLGDKVLVYHMGSRRIDRDSWFDSVNGSRVDLVGIVNGLDRVSRVELIDKAVAYFNRRPQPTHRSCYWMGEGLPCCHPRFPGDGESYGFSCSTFVHQCYEEIGVSIVQTDQIPVVTAQELQDLIQFIGKDNTAAQPFQRLYPSYMIGATETNQIPFSPEDWNSWKDHGRYVPEYARVT